MTVSLISSLPADYDATKGLRGLRPQDQPPISVRSMTNLVSQVFTPTNDLNAGHVFSDHVVLTVFGNGAWVFRANMSDTSVLSGDNFAIGFVFTGGVGWAGIVTGSLGADATSTPQHKRVSVAGRSEVFQRNFHQLGNGIVFKLHVSDDLTQVFDDIFTDLKNLGKEIEVIFTFNSDSGTGTGGAIDGPIDNGDGGDGGDGG
jgi:hypothetical protein